MAGGPSGTLIALTSILLFYMIVVGILATAVITMGNFYQPGANGATIHTPGMSSFGYVPNGSTVTSFLYNGNPNDLGINVLNNSLNEIFGGGQSLNGWAINSTRGLYPVSIGQGTASVTAITSQYAAEVQFGSLSYTYIGNDRQQSKSITFQNLGESGETDILLAVSSWRNGLTTSYFYITVLDGKVYLVNKQSTGFIFNNAYTTNLNCDIGGNPTTNITYTYDMYSGYLTVYVDNTNVFSGLYDMRDTDLLGGPLAYSYGSTEQPIDILTTNMQMSITGTGSVTSEGQIVPDHYVVSITNPFNSTSWWDLTKTFFTITLWSVDGIPLEVNIIFFKIPLLMLVMCLIAIGMSFIP